MIKKFFTTLLGCERLRPREWVCLVGGTLGAFAILVAVLATIYIVAYIMGVLV